MTLGRITLQERGAKSLKRELFVSITGGCRLCICSAYSKQSPVPCVWFQDLYECYLLNLKETNR
jgi:hypothetical protein